MEKADPPKSSITGKPLPDFPDVYWYNEKLLMPNTWFTRDALDLVSSTKLYPDDTIVAGNCKSGTTWLQEITWLLANGINMKVSEEKCVWDRVPSIELTNPGQKELTVHYVNRMPRPRLFKTNLPYYIFEKEIKAKKPKIIVILRNPKDTLVSFFHFLNSVYADLIRSFEDMFECARDKWFIYGDHFDHMLGYWANRDQPNFLFTKYEDLKEDPHREISRIATFMEKDLSAEELDKVVQATTFKSMKKNPGTNMTMVDWIDQSKHKFQRKGIVGDWHNYFTEEQSQFIDKRCKEELLPEGLEFRF